MSVILDERSHIGPHHLAIGKTRKLLRAGDDVFAFFSRGYEIAMACCDARTGAMRDTVVLDLPVSWGGGAFCVDDDGAGRVVMVFVNRDLRQLCFVEGRAAGGKVIWQPWRAILSGDVNQAAPWVSLDEVGTAWATVLERNGNFRIATVTRDGKAQAGSLFNPGEVPWYHSCVQALPLGNGQCVAVGFRGTFPTRTELVGKTIASDLVTGPSQSICPCDVNDRLTFHFQALGDPGRQQAHIVYLDDGLSVSHAILSGGAWQIEKNVMAFASLAPQICLDESGSLILLAADYEGRVVESRKPPGGPWSAPVQLEGVTGPNISPLFALTNYGTGGMISDARSRNGVVPLLIGCITDEREARAVLSLHLAGIGATRPVQTAPPKPFPAETTAMMAQNPELILRTYRRMV
jgi:hypothetical protein